MSTGPTVETHKAENLQDEATRHSPYMPWTPENTVTRLEEAEQMLERILGLHHTLIDLAGHECTDCKKRTLAMLLKTAASTCKTIKSYAQHLAPGSNVDFCVFEGPTLMNETTLKAHPVYELLDDTMRQTYPGIPWDQKNELIRLKNIEQALKSALKLHRILLNLVEDGCAECQKIKIGTILRNIAHACERLRSYAKYLEPGTVIYFCAFN